MAVMFVPVTGIAVAGSCSPEARSAEQSCTWYLAEGYTAEDFDTWICIQNPGNEEANVTLSFQLRDGEADPVTLTLPPQSRESVSLDALPGLGEAQVSTKVTSDRPVVAERAMYFSYRGKDGGHASIGTTSLIGSDGVSEKDSPSPEDQDHGNGPENPDDPEDPEDPEVPGPGNISPVAVINAPAVAKVGEEVLFDASKSHDPDGTIVSWRWDFGDGVKAEGDQTSHTFEHEGDYNIKLMVTDDGGAENMAQRRIMVREQEPPDTRPTASFEFTPCPVQLINSEVEFSDTSEGAVWSWEWDFGDGTTSSEKNPVHRYGKTGTYTVILKVNGPFGGDECEREIEIRHHFERDEIVEKEVLIPVSTPSGIDLSYGALQILSTKNLFPKDTVLLNEDVYIDATVYYPDPEITRGRWPAVIATHGWAGDKGEREGFGMGDVGSFAQEGYIGLTYAYRGWGGSTGYINTMGPNDIQDLKDIVTWLADDGMHDGTTTDSPDFQAKLDGPKDPRVGMFGHSGGGFMSMMLAGQDPDRVDAVAPCTSPGDLYHDLAPGGCVKSFIDILLSTGAVAAGVPYKELYENAPYGWLNLLNNPGLLPSTDLDIPSWMLLMITGFKGDTEEDLMARSPLLYAGDIKCPVMLQHGWFDSMFETAALSNYLTIKENPYYSSLDEEERDERLKLLLFPGEHNYSGGSSQRLHAWFAYWLKDQHDVYYGLADDYDGAPLSDLITSPPVRSKQVAAEPGEEELLPNLITYRERAFGWNDPAAFERWKKSGTDVYVDPYEGDLWRIYEEWDYEDLSPDTDYVNPRTDLMHPADEAHPYNPTSFYLHGEIAGDGKADPQRPSGSAVQNPPDVIVNAIAGGCSGYVPFVEGDSVDLSTGELCGIPLIKHIRSLLKEAVDENPAFSAVYQTEELAEDLTVIGTPQADLRCSILPAGLLETGLLSAHFEVKVTDVDQGGQEEVVARGFKSVSFLRDQLEGEDPVFLNLRFPLFPMEHVFGSGHRLKIIVTNSECLYIMPSLLPTVTTIYVDEDRPSSVMLPVIGEGPSNRPPTADAGPDMEVTVGDEVRLDGSGSSDPDGDPLTYAWEITARPEGSEAALDDPSSATPAFTADKLGSYEIELLVSDGKGASDADAVTVTAVPPRLSNPISDDDYQVLGSYGESYLAANGAGKKLLYLEGDAYQRGYAEGYLCPKGVYRMTHDYVDNFISGLLGLPIGEVGFSAIAPVVRRIIRQAVLSQEYAVPEEYRQEMWGIADGARDRGYDVTYKDVFLINVGFDFLYSLVYQGGSLLCNEFGVFGEGTADGRLYHGRDFMFTTGGDVFSDEALVMVHVPTQGYPLAGSAAPGFVGMPTGLNSQGISFGMDMVPNRQNRAVVSGMGCLLLCRDVLQRAASMQEGIGIVRNTPRGVSWLFMIADGKIPDAAVLETVADRMIAEGDDLLATLIGLLPGLDRVVSGTEEILGAEIMDGAGEVISGVGDLVLEGSEMLPILGDVHPDRGVAVRTSDYVDPEGLEEYRLVIHHQDPLVPHSEDTVISPFPLQREREPGLVAMTNHYILPQMNLTQMGLFYHTIDTQQGGGRQSEWRYDTMLDLLLKHYGDIERVTAMWLIDFLNPARCDYYGTDISQSVKGHHVLMDNHSLEMWSLHGYYDQPWQHVDLGEILGLPEPPPPQQAAHG